MPDDGDGCAPLRLVIEANAPSVRVGLARLFAAAPLSALSGDARGNAEIVLAEVLNNIVEHAYAHRTGTIDLTVGHGPRGLTCRVEDDGLPMPGGGIPCGERPVMHGAGLADLHEGGFGWHLVQSLSPSRDYRRIGDRNRLTLVLATEDRAPGDV